tara:strand:- start:165 stop:641 length:477 start_codon:yes stop_codon:yes gene_type:complete
MKTERIFYSGEYRRHAIGFSILITILATPFIILMVRVGLDMSGKKEVTTYLLSITAMLYIAFLGIRRLLEKREVKVSESGVLYGRTMRPWSDIKAIKPLKLIGKKERKFHLMCIYKGIGSVGVKIPLQTALTSEEYCSLADELEVYVQPHHPKLKIER